MPFFTWVEGQCDVCERSIYDRVEGHHVVIDGNCISESVWRQVTDLPWTGHEWFLCSAACAEHWVRLYGRSGQKVTMRLRDGVHTFKAAPTRSRHIARG